MTKLLVTIAFLGLNFYVYNFMAKAAVIPPRDTFDSFPLRVGAWSCSENEPLPADVEANLGATDTFICQFQQPGNPAPLGLYIGYHQTQIREEGGGAGENAIHPPAHCLPGSGWDIIHSETVPLRLEGLPEDGEAKRLIIAKGDYRQLVYYWYQMQGRAIAQDWQKILYVGYDRASTGRTDGALVRFSIPYAQNDVEAAEKSFQEFAPQIAPLLTRYVPN
jgi:EpsI family protein